MIRLTKLTHPESKDLAFIKQVNEEVSLTYFTCLNADEAGEKYYGPGGGVPSTEDMDFDSLVATLMVSGFKILKEGDAP